ncbi:LysE family transporter [Kribbella shirazensis]|uniref:Arginine exporter protein ArgO n=1 Tax=Kribbella shirazensis TaxID=1105143 RepID=A0A7X5VDE1_9ACTN|nr:LysE family transporter [Kribbella shirazensis]NIK58283.1 arginine exporter protein ArgO [Kribbella shirazensis]
MLGVDARSVVIGAVVAGLLAGYGVAMPVGPVGTYLVALTARSSLRIGAFAALGVASADGVYAAVAAGAGSVLAPLLVPIVGPLRWASVVVLVGLAVMGAVRAVRRYRDRRIVALQHDTPIGAWTAYFGMLGMTMLNPWTVIYFAALVLGGSEIAGAGERIVFVVAAFVASASWQLLLAGGGALLGRLLTGPTGRLVTALASSAVIVVLAVRIVA